MKKLFILFLFFISISTYAQEIKITGNVKDAATGDGVSGASITVKDKLTGTVSDTKGHFILSLSRIKLPVTLIVSATGFGNEELKVTDAQETIAISLQQKHGVLNEVVFAASRVNESILRSPVSIEKMNLQAIRENPSLSFYDGIQNLKGVDAVTSSLTYKQINTRGFNSTGNQRFLQLVDGVDNQTPGLNFSVGNQFGTSDIDIESVEVIPGAASALYGPIAFSGVLMMQTKNPFQYQGLTLQAKTGINHIGEDDAKPHGLYDFALRYAKAFNNRFAFKINASYLTGLDWYANNYTDIDAQTPANMRGPNNPGRDGVNIYGDEVVRTIAGIGRVSRTGYEERSLMNYNVYSLKLSGALHYRITHNMELSYQYNYGKGTASYTGSSRFDLNNFVLQQHRAELKGSNYFLRSYAVIENSHDSYNTRSLAQFLNRTWVKDLNGNTVAPADADNMWFNRYTAAYNGDVDNVSATDHSAARAFADQGRLLPGSAAFDQAKDNIIHNYGLSGAGVFSNSKFYHTEGQYDFTKHIQVFELLAGGNFRYYDMFTNGSLFDDKNQKISIKEYGAFVQASKRLLDDKLKLTASLRYDKNNNFSGSFTPRFSGVYTVAKNHNVRASYQTGFRNPTPVDLYIHLNVGTITILGGAPNNSKGMNVYENSFTASSVSAFGAAFGAAMASGTPFPQAIADNKGLLQKSNVSYIKPEKQKAFEVGYKGLIQNQLLVDVNYYHSSYNNFIINAVVIRPEHTVLGNDGQINGDAASDIPNGKVQAFQLYTNAADKVSSQGASIGLTYMMAKGYTIGANGTWAEFDIRDANPNNIPAFNTPKFGSNVTFGNADVFKNFGFNIAWHWQDAFDWYGTFNGNRPGSVNAYSLVDLQINKKIPSIHSVIKLGGSNILNNRVYQSFGSPYIGSLYYVSITFDGLLK
jgi:iron complex outermembrane recepter protein